MNTKNWPDLDRVVEVIADVPEFTEGDGDAVIARARLIVAAPDLLAALKAVDSEGRDANKDGDVTIPSHVWDLVQAALEKATQPAPVTTSTEDV